MSAVPRERSRRLRRRALGGAHAHLPAVRGGRRQRRPRARRGAGRAATSAPSPRRWPRPGCWSRSSPSWARSGRRSARPGWRPTRARTWRWPPSWAGTAARRCRSSAPSPRSPRGTPEPGRSPAEGPRAALSAVADGCDALVVDPAGPRPAVVRRPVLWALAQGRSWVPPAQDPEVLGAVEHALAGVGVDVASGPGSRAICGSGWACGPAWTPRSCRRCSPTSRRGSRRPRCSPSASRASSWRSWKRVRNSWDESDIVDGHVPGPLPSCPRAPRRPAAARLRRPRPGARDGCRGRPDAARRDGAAPGVRRRRSRRRPRRPSAWRSDRRGAAAPSTGSACAARWSRRSWRRPRLGVGAVRPVPGAPRRRVRRRRPRAADLHRRPAELVRARARRSSAAPPTRSTPWEWSCRSWPAQPSASSSRRRCPRRRR